MANGTSKRALAGLVAVVVALWAGLGVWWIARDDDGAADVPATLPTLPGEERIDPTRPVVNVDGATGEAEPPSAPLGVTLGDGAPSGVGDETVEVVDGEPISPDDAASMFEALPPLAPPAPDDDGFSRPPESRPPPVVGDTIEASFPPPDGGDRPEPDAGPLEVARYQPEGDVDLVPFVSVTFTRPMVPLATLDQLDIADVPVEIMPAVDGRWRWIGTRTLRFEVVPGELDRLPAATEYRVVVPGGTTSADGGILDAAVTWEFATPPPSVTAFAGSDETTSLEPVFVATFDQRIDPEAVLATVSLTVDEDPVEVRLATDDEVGADATARAAMASALDSRAVAFRPIGRLPADAAFTIRIGPGTPSTEGPRTSDVVSIHRGRTFGELTIAETFCNYGSDCEPGAPFTIRFSNALDPAAFSADQIAIDPPIENLTVNVSGSTIELFGATRGRTTYTVTFDGALRDVFGQTLGADRNVEFEVGSARPALLGLQRDWITLDPGAERPEVSVTTVNHDSIRARAWAVSPAELPAFRRYQEAQWSDAEATEPDWQLVFDETIDVDADRDEFVETSIDLTSAFAQSGSQLVVRIDPTLELSDDDDAYWRNRPTIAWVQSTTLAIDAFFDHETLVVWTTDLATGETASGIPVELIGDGRVATTDAEGLAELELSESGVIGLYANAGDRTAFLPAQWYEGWQAQTRTDEGVWYVFDDRGIYRPGETARLTGWVRELVRSDDGRLTLYDAGTVRYQAWDAQGSEIGSGSTELNALGGFNLTIDVPRDANLGPAYVEFQLEGESNVFGSHSFAVQEFRRPEFEVSAATETPGPFFAADAATVRVDAEYFSGGPLPGADVNWLVGTRDATYAPPGWDRFTFGIWQPWWSTGRGDDVGADIAADVEYAECFDCGPGFDVEYEEFSGVTNGAGSHYLQIAFHGEEVDLPKTVTAEATVFDVNRQAWAARTDLLVHAAELYVGLRTDRAFVRQDSPIRVDAVVTDVDGELVPDREAVLTAGRLEWVRAADGSVDERIVDEQTCTIASTADAADESMRCEFTTEVGGQYRITATVTDDDGHSNRTELTQWVSGGTARPTRDVERGDVTIVPDRETYADGDTAELLVQAPFSPAHGVVTIVRNGILSTEAFEAEDGSAVLELPIEDRFVPNVTVAVEMVGATIRSDDDGNPVPDAPLRPAYASGQISLSIPPINRALDVSAVPAEAAVEPGDQTSVTVTVTDADGDLVSGADVAIVVVDEAVLALTGYALADPLDVFYRDVWSELNREYTRSSVLLTRRDGLGTDGGRAGADAVEESADESAAADTDAASDDAAGEGASATSPTIDVRTDFDALAVYAPDESTDDTGTVTVDVPLPDSLTRYRVMAVAIDGAERFGKGESTITARLPLQVRPSAPRFLNFGDRFELPVVVQNLTDDPMEVDVAIEVANLKLTGVVGRTVTVPANDRVEVRFPVTTDQVGTARFRVMGTSGELGDAAEGELPVYTPATAEAFATYGVIDDGAIAQPTVAPTDVFPQFGGLEINTSSTALQALTDAVVYLADYRYESADSLASRIMAIATLRPVLDAFDADGLPAAGALDAAVERDLAKLQSLQNDDGGFPYWQRGRSSVPYVSIQTTHALVVADAAAYRVPSGTLDRALEHLASIEEFFPADYGQQLRDSLSAYALYVRDVAGRSDAAKANDLLERVGDELEADALAWLWPSITGEGLRTELERRLVNAAVDTAGAVTFATAYDEDAYVIAESEHRTDAIVLDALITQTPASDLIPKVVAGLLAGRDGGRWSNAQENAFALVALNRYFGTFETVTPDFVARAWLGDRYTAEAVFQGRSTDQVSTVVPTSELIAAGDTTLIVQKDGDGRLYYRLGLRYAPSDLTLAPRDEGFVVDRVYEAVDDPGDVRRNDDGTWTIRQGATVRVTLTMVADARRTHVALIDPLPAGLEPVDPSLAVSTTIPPPGEDDVAEGTAAGDASRPGYWGWNWFDHQNLRDDRVEAFAGVLPGGTYEYTYVARATTPGTFVVPPARAEEIYAPETFGRSASATVVVG